MSYKPNQSAQRMKSFVDISVLAPETGFAVSHLVWAIAFLQIHVASNTGNQGFPSTPLPSSWLPHMSSYHHGHCEARDYPHQDAPTEHCLMLIQGVYYSPVTCTPTKWLY
jgi:hypothetical protein